MGVLDPGRRVSVVWRGVPAAPHPTCSRFSQEERERPVAGWEIVVMLGQRELRRKSFTQSAEIFSAGFTRVKRRRRGREARGSANATALRLEWEGAWTAGNPAFAGQPGAERRKPSRDSSKPDRNDGRIGSSRPEGAAKVPQVTRPAVRPITRSAGRCPAMRVWRLAIRQTWRFALPRGSRNEARACPTGAGQAQPLRRADSMRSQKRGLACRASSSPVGRAERKRKSLSELRLRMRWTTSPSGWRSK